MQLSILIVVWLWCLATVTVDFKEYNTDPEAYKESQRGNHAWALFTTAALIYVTFGIVYALVWLGGLIFDKLLS